MWEDRFRYEPKVDVGVGRERGQPIGELEHMKNSPEVRHQGGEAIKMEIALHRCLRRVQGRK